MSWEFEYHHVHDLLHSIHRDNKLFHLLKGTEDEAKSIMADILVSHTLRGGNGFIRGGYTCVCAGELPMSQISQYLADPNALDQDYRAIGVIFDKHWFFTQGGRPVIYQPENEFDLLHDDMKHLHMLYDPHAEYDFSWIREWRVKADTLKLDLTNALAVFPNRSWKREVLAMARDRAGDPETINAWETLALTDIGISVLEGD
ncbi:hypothetical protein [Roseibium aggregatum]|uniref:Uncharacterized protein n=1 Tax=Roseibium aggregatum TaxID=187304 RepID=A0A926S950_9HYPH|nr:hypothetical protein [Roseibium aggregatum]MBD1546024.1 hypothetical protein [Roseibium aggregatum]